MLATIILAAVTAILPPREEKAVNRIAREYSFNAEQTALLAAIRRAENGRKALAFGVMDGRCRTYDRQVRWAANTIHLRYSGDLEAFARRWCPLDWRNWLKNVRWFMKKQGVNKYAN